MAKSRERLTAQLDVQMRDLKAKMSAIDRRATANESRLQRQQSFLRRIEQQRQASERRINELRSRVRGFAATQVQTSAGLAVGLAFGGGSDVEQVAASAVAALIATGNPAMAAAAAGISALSLVMSKLIQEFREFSKEFTDSLEKLNKKQLHLEERGRQRETKLEKDSRKLEGKLTKIFESKVRELTLQTARAIIAQEAD